MMNLPIYHEKYCAQSFWYGYALQRAAQKQVKHSETFNKLLHMYEYADTACAYIQHHPEKVSEAHRRAANKAHVKAVKNIDTWLASITVQEPKPVRTGVLFDLDDELIII